MEDLVLSDKSLDLTIEGFSWSGNSVANELDFVTQVIKDAAADNTSVLIWQPVDRNASAPAAVLAVNAGLKLLWVDEFVVGYQNNGIGTQTTSIPQPHDAPRLTPQRLFPLACAVQLYSGRITSTVVCLLGDNFAKLRRLAIR
jgi:hypothetical protein